MRNMLGVAIQETLLDCSARFIAEDYREGEPRDDFLRKEKLNLVAKLYAMYSACFANTPNECKDNLVPLSEKCILDEPVSINDWGCGIEYRWPSTDPTKQDEEYPEFVGIIDTDAVIKKDSFVDRLGPAYGKYLSPVPINRDVFTVAERAIPYLFLAGGTMAEPSYHRYQALKDITYDDLYDAIENSQVLSDDTKRKLKKEMDESLMVYGRIAPVDAFEPQGVGGGDQYKLCIGVAYLLQLKFLKEV